MMQIQPALSDLLTRLRTVLSDMLGHWAIARYAAILTQQVYDLTFCGTELMVKQWACGPWKSYRALLITSQLMLRNRVLKVKDWYALRQAIVTSWTLSKLGEQNDSVQLLCLSYTAV